MDYHDHIQSYFIGTTGRGLVLSSEDVRFLTECKRLGVPAASVCMAIDRAIESRGELPRSIRACSYWIEAPGFEPKYKNQRPEDIGAYLSWNSERRDDQKDRRRASPSQSYRKTIKCALKEIEAAAKVSAPSVLDVYRAAYQQLMHIHCAAEKERISKHEMVEILWTVQQQIEDELWKQLPEDVRRNIELSIQQAIPDDLPPNAHHEFKELQRRIELYRRFNIPRIT